jgi:alpha-tubulin suppressor-like RCC1 family protein
VAEVVSGPVWSWGAGADGQLGTGSVGVDQGPPQRTGSPERVTAIAAGPAQGYALDTDGHVWSWGSGTNGELGDGTTSGATLPVLVPALDRVVGIAAAGGAPGLGGEATAYALRADGAVWAWGAGGAGQLGTGRALSSTTPVKVVKLGMVTALAGGGRTAYALRRDGTVWAWGAGSTGELGDGSRPLYRAFAAPVPGLDDVVAVAAGNATGYALRADHTVWAWGNGGRGQLGTGTTSGSAVPVRVSGLTDVTAIAGGNTTAYALRADHTVWAWGNGGRGQLGTGTTGTTGSTVPVRIPTLAAISMIAGSGGGGYAVCPNGLLWTWGVGAGALTGGPDQDSLVPVRLTGLPRVARVASGANGFTGYALTTGDVLPAGPGS